MTASSLRNQNCKELAQMARAVGLSGWHSMRKEELIKALSITSRRKPKRPTGPSNGRLSGRCCRLERVCCQIENARTTPATSNAAHRDSADFVLERNRASLACSGPAGGDGPGPLLVACPLGTLATERSASSVRAWATLACHATGSSAFSCGGGWGVGAPAGNSDSWRGKSLVRRCAESAAAIPHGNRVFDRGRAVLLSGAQQYRHDTLRLARAIPSTKTGPISIKMPTASSL